MISVLVRTHLRPRLLHVALNSIMAQTYQDYEIVLISDAKEDLPSNDRLRVMRVRPLGYPACNLYLNRAIREARGDVICFLDDDDMYTDPNYFQVVTRAVEGGYRVVLSRFEIRPGYMLLRTPEVVRCRVGTPCFAVHRSVACRAQWRVADGDFHYITGVLATVPPEKVLFNPTVIGKSQLGHLPGHVGQSGGVAIA